MTDPESPRPPEDYPRPAVAVDLVILTIVDADLKVLLVRRKAPPFEGGWALPGGFVRVGEGDDQGEDLDDAAARELQEETGLHPANVYLAQLQAFGRANRDPRMRVISVAYYALVRPDLASVVHAGGDAADVDWHATADVLSAQVPLAFDHLDMLRVALERVGADIERSNLAFELVPRTFTVAELRSVFEVVHDRAYDPGNFRRRFQRMLTDGVIAQARGKRITTKRPAKVYRFVRSPGATP